MRNVPWVALLIALSACGRQVSPGGPAYVVTNCPDTVETAMAPAEAGVDLADALGRDGTRLATGTWLDDGTSTDLEVSLSVRDDVVWRLETPGARDCAPYRVEWRVEVEVSVTSDDGRVDTTWTDRVPTSTEYAWQTGRWIEGPDASYLLDELGRDTGPEPRVSVSLVADPTWGWLSTPETDPNVDADIRLLDFAEEGAEPLY